ncbi:hypothetical protein [Corynebacterium appendicis]|uniref:hypothetical protein n=1 Tax=Corynebacterium appendicis TaxID=163202 RepID=UPI00255006D8|nr:hypothetical protein [Corynebacterium appendicis]MDK8626235.1 hypothetical protein [Corynebacterium appendicis]
MIPIIAPATLREAFTTEPGNFLTATTRIPHSMMKKTMSTKCFWSYCVIVGYVLPVCFDVHEAGW